MKLKLIAVNEIKVKHPIGIKSTTDIEYARIATEVLNEIAKEKVHDISAEGLRKIAINVTMYFEDVVADAGIWRAFTDKMKEMYGRTLPFYDVDEATYYPDEPNLNDVRLLVWYTMLEVHHGKIGNPENPILDRIAERAYSVLDKHFETVGVNEELKNYFAKADFANDFYEQRNFLIWLVYSCYLTYNPYIKEQIYDEAQKLTAEIGVDFGHAYYVVECQMPYTTLIGPLELKPQEWAEAILRANGKKKVGKSIGCQQHMPYSGYKVVEAKEGESLTLMSTDEETFTVSSYCLNNPVEEAYKAEGVIGCFVKYCGEWNLNGDMSNIKDMAYFNELHEEYLNSKRLKPIYKKLKKDTSVYYFAGSNEMKNFILENLPIEEEAKKNLSIPEEHKNIVLYVPDDYKSELEIYPDGALCIRDERNPYYNAKWAKNQSVNFILSIANPEFRRYLVSHNMLPDATINSSKGVERGNEIVQQNFDFIVRAVSTRL